MFKWGEAGVFPSVGREGWPEEGWKETDWCLFIGNWKIKCFLALTMSA